MGQFLTFVMGFSLGLYVAMLVFRSGTISLTCSKCGHEAKSQDLPCPKCDKP